MNDMAQSTRVSEKETGWLFQAKKIKGPQVVYNPVGDFLKHVFCFLATVCAFCDFVLVVIETFVHISLEEHGFALSVCKQMFLSIFLLEIVVKWCIGFKAFWKCCWNVANLLISLSYLVGCRMTYDPKVLISCRVLHMIRMIICFTPTQDSKRLVQIIKKSLVDVSIILIPFMLFLMVYTASGVNLFSATSAFQSLESALYTLFFCLHQEGCGDTFIQFKEERMIGLLYFALFLICGILFWAYDETVFMSNSEIVLQDIMNGESPTENSNSEDRPGQNADFKDQAMIHVEKVIKQTNMTKHQKPLMNGYPLNLTLETYENLILVLSSIQSNLEEGHELEQEMNKILMELQLHSANQKQIYRPKIHKKGTCCIEEELAIGDILTTLINLDKANILDTSTGTPHLNEGMTLDIEE